MSDFWNPKQNRKARKVHRCVWCGEHILVGEEYAFQSAHYDGIFQQSHYHEECWDDIDWRDVEDGFALYSAERPEPLTKSDDN